MKAIGHWVQFWGAGLIALIQFTAPSPRNITTAQSRYSQNTKRPA